MGRLHLRVYPSSDSIARYPPSQTASGDVELDDVVVIRSVGVLGYGVLVVRREAVSLRDHPDGGGRRVVRLGLARCLLGGGGDGLLEGGSGGGRRLGCSLWRRHGVFVRAVLVVNVCGGGLVVRVTFVVV